MDLMCRAFTYAGLVSTYHEIMTTYNEYPEILLDATCLQVELLNHVYKTLQLQIVGPGFTLPEPQELPTTINNNVVSLENYRKTKGLA